ncbi:hypothetical protein [Spirosoma agri]|uniref:Uncharacterized protein n=1 Tax=Spirosoma agri TaxID=1987381 RepID=A0A6M0II78_9BACT|nr:hypothetical protein [Spirosoma agri]NEU67949.1 hypothetical protein [Spirosoma agri]
MNLVESESSHQDYSIIEKPGGNDFTFTTAHGITYLVYFTEADGYVPSASFVNETKMLGFGPKKGTYPMGKSLPDDPEVWPTIFEVLYLYMTHNPNRVLLYVCSNESVWRPGPDDRDDRYAKKRNEIFGVRFNEWQETGVMPAENIGFRLYDNNYCGCIFRSDNPYADEVRAVIDKTVLEKV